MSYKFAYEYDDDEQRMLLGRVFHAIYMSDDQHWLRFDTIDGESVYAEAVGDCCSNTWFDHIECPEHLLHATIVKTERKDYKAEDRPESSYKASQEEIQYYGLEIVTSKGYALIDFRNESNGYYSGHIEWGEPSRHIDTEWKLVI